MFEAKLNREYALRISGVGILLFALAAWSIYDGAYAWPKANCELDKVREELVQRTQSGITPEEWLATPKEGGECRLQQEFMKISAKTPKSLVQDLGNIVEQGGNSDEDRKKRIDATVEVFKRPIYSDKKIKGQYVQASILIVLSLCVFYAVLSKRGVIYRADEEGLSGNGFGGGHIAWEDVKSVDWSKWQDKGIIKMTFKSGSKVKLDAWHFAGFSKIAELIAIRFPMPCEEADEKQSTSS